MSKTIKIGQRELLLKDIIIAIIISALPILYYTYKMVPPSETWQTKLFTIQSFGFDNVQVVSWIICSKLLLIGILSIWFITCKHWWRNAIMVPLIIELYKLLAILNDSNKAIDEVEFLTSIPITLPIILALLFISNKMKYYSKSMDLSYDLNNEIEILINELTIISPNKINILNSQFKNIKKNKNEINKEDYLNLLIELRNKIIQAS